MSKIDDLVEIFNQEFWVTASRRAGIAAVVRALRDELEVNGEHQSCHVLTKILGDAGEKAAGVAALEVASAGHTSPDLRTMIEHAINEHSAERGSNTPDFILAGYLISCLAAFDTATNARSEWYGKLSATATAPNRSGYTEYMNETLPMKVADHAPDVCEWRRDPDPVQMVSACGYRVDCSPYFFVPTGDCPSCGKPISFKEPTK